jgi:uncharacterized protein
MINCRFPERKTMSRQMVELIRHYTNLHGVLSAVSGSNAISGYPEFGNRFLEEFQDRLYQGTDHAKLPFVPYFRNLKEKYFISDEAHDNIIWKNATRMRLE